MTLRFLKFKSVFFFWNPYSQSLKQQSIEFVTTKSSTAAGCTRCRLSNTRTCPHMFKRTCGNVLLLSSRRLMCPAADDDFVIELLPCCLHTILSLYSEEVLKIQTPIFLLIELL